MAGYHNITGIRRTAPRAWKIVHFSQFSDGQEIITSLTVGLPGILSHVRENIHIRGLGKDLAETILDAIILLIIEGKSIVEPGDTIGHEHRKFLVLRESIPSSICTLERSILVLDFMKPTERQF